MSKIHYFQRYSQKENWVTNNTLLLLSRLYYYSRLKLEVVLNEILGHDQVSLNIGVNFTQQGKGNRSVADGVIAQESFQILIETKLYDNFSIDQLVRHLEGFDEKYETKILLALSKNEATIEIRKQVNDTIKSGNFEGIKFATTSFEQLISSIGDSLDQHDAEMTEILEDYSSLCQEHGLIDQSQHTMLAVTVGQSLKENLEYNIYYDPVNRNHNLNFKYLGLYDKKRIKAVGEVKKTVYCDYVKGELISSNGEQLDLTQKESQALIDIIEKTDYYNLSRGTKFMLVDEFYETNFIKTSHSSLRAKKYFFLKEIEGYQPNMDAVQIANLLNGQPWE